MDIRDELWQNEHTEKETKTAARVCLGLQKSNLELYMIDLAKYLFLRIDVFWKEHSR